MGIILNQNEIYKIHEQKLLGKTIVLVGGSFDILHSGHIEFLKRAKKLGNELIVFVESDETIKKIKGKNRPVNSQNDRATVLANISVISYVIKLSSLNNDSDYEILVKTLQPDIIATSGSDKVFDWEKKLEKKGFFKIIKVMERIGNHSTTELIKKIKV